MDTAYMSQLQKLVRACNKELDRAQAMDDPPSEEFPVLLFETEEAWSDAHRRFVAKRRAEESVTQGPALAPEVVADMRAARGDFVGVVNPT